MTPHRSQFSGTRLEALRVLDRATDGQPVSPRAITHALQVTGDIGWQHATHAQTDFRDIRALRVFARDHESASEPEVS